MKAFIESYELITALGNGVSENTEALLQNTSGVFPLQFNSNLPSYPLGKIKNHDFKLNNNYFDQLLDDGISLFNSKNNIDWKNPELIVLISTTKGNIEALKSVDTIEQSHLYTIAQKLQTNLELFNTPEVISNACISGVSALIWGQRYITCGIYSKVVIIGIDIISTFVLAGFHSFMALSDEKSKPFDANRKGLNLGEAIGIICLGTQNSGIEISGGGISNDANHISGPSRTGDGLALAIEMAMKEADVSFVDINYISAHGTATPYNDEMECKAFHLCHLENTPLNSYKGYVGHTLGAAGIIETIFAVESIKQQTLFTSLGYQEHGVSLPLAVIRENKTQAINTVLKTASGFGGGNSALIIQRV